MTGKIKYHYGQKKATEEKGTRKRQVNQVVLIQVLISLILQIFPDSVSAQDLSQPWNLNQCIEWATSNHLQVKKAVLQTGQQSSYLKQAQAGRWPDLSAQALHTFANDQTKDQLTGDYNSQQYNAGNFSLGASVTLFNGNRINNNIKQQALSLEASELAVQEAQNNIEIAVTQAYLDILLASETVKQARQTLEGSGAQKEWAQNHYDAGSMSQADFAMIRSQYSTDEYSLTVANNEYTRKLLVLKQLLELDLEQSLSVTIPELADSLALLVIPGEAEVYRTAVAIMPEISRGKVSVESAKLDKKIANAGYWPVISANAGVATAYNTLSSDGIDLQIAHGLNEYAGLNMSIPIFSGRKNKTAREVAQIKIEESNLSLEEEMKNLLASVENAWLNTITSQNRFKAASGQLEAASISYRLSEEQFNLGLKNSVDLITAKNNFLQAQQEFTQAKYSALLYFKLLDFYQGKPITL